MTDRHHRTVHHDALDPDDGRVVVNRRMIEGRTYAVLDTRTTGSVALDLAGARALADSLRTAVAPDGLPTHRMVPIDAVASATFTQPVDGATVIASVWVYPDPRLGWLIGSTELGHDPERPLTWGGVTSWRSAGAAIAAMFDRAGRGREVAIALVNLLDPPDPPPPTVHEHPGYMGQIAGPDGT